MNNQNIEYFVKVSILKNLYFNHKITFVQFTNSLLLLKDDYQEKSKDSQLAITM